MTTYVRSLKIGLLIFLSVVTNYVHASAKTDFMQGAELFKSAHYSKAVKKFESAHKQGMKSTALYYNLGSSYYKLKKYNKARSYFKSLSKIPSMKSLAEYNLGLIALKQGKTDKAAAYFEAVIGDKKDRKLVYLATRMINKIPVEPKSWSVYSRAKLAYDDNINFAPTGTVLDESDMFLDLMVAADYLLKGVRSNGWIGDASIYLTNYFDSGLYDQDQYGFGIKKTRRINEWETYFKINFDKITYGHDDYQSIIKLAAQGKHKISRNERLYLQYRYEDITSDNVIYDYLDGWRQKFSVKYLQYNKQHNSQLYYELELNNRKDLVVAGNEFSYSPTRHTIRAKHTKILDKQWRITGDVAYRTSDYSSTSTQNRSDERWKIAGYTDYRIDKTMKIQARLERTDNNSNEAIYDYKRTMFSLGISKLF